MNVTRAWSTNTSIIASDPFIRIILVGSFRRNLHRYRAIAIVFFAVLCGHSSVTAKSKDDFIFLNNGDRMTGEIKSLVRGVLSFKADYMADPVRLDWTKVKRIESKDHYIITLTSGNLYTGSFALAAPGRYFDENFVISAGNETVKVRQDEVIRLLPIETRMDRSTART